MLAKDAFTNFATIMNDVSLSPAMGGYLNMLNSDKPATGQIANENYPRELMQLFTTGIDMLNSGWHTPTDSNGNPIPVYTETQVRGLRPRLYRMDLRQLHRRLPPPNFPTAPPTTTRPWQPSKAHMTPLPRLC